MSPEIEKTPLEFYGEVYSGDRDVIEDRRERNHCPFREDDVCQKESGVCTVGHPMDDPEAHCICPHRLETDSVLRGLEDTLEGEGELFILTEVALEMGRENSRSIDYVIGKEDKNRDIVTLSE